MEAGAVYVPIIPTARDALKSMTKELTEGASKAGTQAAKDLSRNMVKYIDGQGRVTIKPKLDPREVDRTLAKIAAAKLKIEVKTKIDSKAAKAQGKKAGEAVKQGVKESTKGGILPRSVFSGMHSEKSGKSEGRRFASSYREAVKEQVKGIGALFAGAFVLDKTKDIAKESIEAFEDQEKINRQTQTVIESTGRAAGITEKHVSALAGSLSKLTGQDDDVVQSAENLLLTFKNIRNTKTDKIFDETTKATLDMAAAMHVSAKSSAMQLAKALNDPAKGMTRLTRVGVTFTKQQQDQVKHYMKLGQTAKAQQVILKEVNSEFKGSAEAAATPAMKARAAWHELQEQIGSKLLPIVDDLAKWFVSRGIPLLVKFGTYIQQHVVPVIKDDLIPVFKSLWRGWLQPIFTFVAGHVKTFAILAATLYGVVKAIKLITAVTKLWAAAQAIFNAVSEANPFVLIISAIVALGVALFVAYKKSETFRNFVNKLWAGLKTGFSVIVNAGKAVVHFFSTTLPNAVMVPINYLRQHWRGILQIILAPFLPIPVLVWKYFGPISSIAKSVFGVVVSIVRTTWKVLKTIGMVIYAIFALPVILALKAIQRIFKVVWGWVGPYVMAVMRRLQKIASTMFHAVYTVVSTVLHAILGIIRTVLGAVAKVWSAVWHAVYAVIRAVWHGIKAFLTAEFRGFRIIASGAWHAIAHVITAVWGTIGGPIKKTWGAVAGFLSGAWRGMRKTASKAWHSLVSDIGKVFGGIKGAVQSVWNKVSGIFDGAIHHIVGLINDFIGLLNKVPGVHIDKIGGGGGGKAKNNQPTGGGGGGRRILATAGAAHGGVLPGYKPGKDTVAAMLSPGEGVLVPEAVRGLGPDFVYAANRHFSSRRGHSPGTERHHYAFGGIVKDVGKFGSWAGSKVKAGADAVNPVHVVNAAFDAAVGGAFGVANKLADKVPTSFGKSMAHGVLSEIRNAVLHDGHADTKKLDMGGASGSKILSYARKFLGTPYVWGGAEPGGFDCSGLVQYVLNHFGIHPPRTAAEQQKWATPESRAAARPGDEVFWGNPAHHTAFYYGNGKILEAPQTGDVVKIASLYGNPSFGRPRGNIDALLGGGLGGGYTSAGGNVGNRALGKKIAQSLGYGSQFAAIDYVFSHESSWNNRAQNPSSTAFGIPQFLNSTWGAYGGKTSDPARQIEDGIRYMVDRYGSPNGAAAYWKKHHVYGLGGIVSARAKGGRVVSGETSLVGEEGPEIVTFAKGGVVKTARQTAKLLTRGDYESSIKPKAKPKPKATAPVKHTADYWARYLAEEVTTTARKAVSKARRGLVAAGNSLADQIMAGMNGTSSVSSVQATTRSVVRAIDGAFTGSRRSKLLAYVQRENRELTLVASRRSAIASRLSQASEYAAGVRGEAVSNGALTSLDASGINTIQAQLQGKVRATRQFAADIKTLQKKGLSQGLINQLLDAGVESGGGIARQLAKAAPGRIKTLNATQRGLESAASKLGTTAANSKFGGNASVDFARTLAKQSSALHQAGSLIGEGFAREIRSVFAMKARATHVVPKSRATHDNGGWLMPGEPGLNLTKNPEAVLTGKQWDIAERALVTAGASPSAEDIGDAFARKLEGRLLKVDPDGFLHIIENAQQRQARRRR